MAKDRRQNDSPKPVGEGFSLADFKGQRAVEQVLIPSLREDRFPHALLITGKDGCGKHTLAVLLTIALLQRKLESESEKEQVRQQVLNSNHPDVMALRPWARKASTDTAPSSARVLVAPLESGNDDETGKRTQIYVVDVRDDASTFLRKTTFTGSGRVLVILDAHKMMPQAQNALLKILEEPPANTFLILTTATPRLLLPTILSRCESVHLHEWQDAYVDAALRKALNATELPDDERLRQIVRSSEGSIGRALELAKDNSWWELTDEVLNNFFGMGGQYSGIFPLAEAWKDRKADSDNLLRCLDEIVDTMLYVRLGKLDATFIRSWPEACRNMAAKADTAEFLELKDAIGMLRQQRDASMVWQPLLEQLLFTIVKETGKWST